MVINDSETDSQMGGCQTCYKEVYSQCEFNGDELQGKFHFNELVCEDSGTGNILKNSIGMLIDIDGSHSSPTSLKNTPFQVRGPHLYLTRWFPLSFKRLVPTATLVARFRL